jgi:hypothetical protein
MTGAPETLSHGAARMERGSKYVDAYRLGAAIFATQKSDRFPASEVILGHSPRTTSWSEKGREPPLEKVLFRPMSALRVPRGECPDHVAGSVLTWRLLRSAMPTASPTHRRCRSLQPSEALEGDRSGGIVDTTPGSQTCGSTGHDRGGEGLAHPTAPLKAEVWNGLSPQAQSLSETTCMARVQGAGRPARIAAEKPGPVPS